MSEPNFLEATVYVFKHKETGEVVAHYQAMAQMREPDKTWEHIASIEPRAWIQAHYAKAVGLDRCPNTPDLFEG